MKKLLFVIPSYRWGGDTTALYNLLNKIDLSKFKVDLFPLIDEGPYRERFSNCTILKGSATIMSLLKRFEFSHGWNSVSSLVLKSLNKLSNGRFLNLVYKRTGKRLMQDTAYDAVIAWTEWEPTTFVSFFPAKSRIAWIHCDYSFNQHSADEDDSYKEMGRIVLVSNYCKGQFINLFPDLRDRAVTIYDILDKQQIISKSKEFIDDYPVGEGFHLLSYGRIAPGKRFSSIPQIASRIKESGVSFHWSIMGPDQHPEELALIQQSIVNYHVQDCVDYLGVRANPFPYIRQADLVVNTSASEALCYSILEPAILGTPTVNADFDVAYEVLDEGKNGLIVPLEEMAGTIVRFLQDPRLRGEIKENLKKYSYSDEEAMRGFEQLFF